MADALADTFPQSPPLLFHAPPRRHISSEGLCHRILSRGVTLSKSMRRKSNYTSKKQITCQAKTLNLTTSINNQVKIYRFLPVT